MSIEFPQDSLKKQQRPSKTPPWYRATNLSGGLVPRSWSQRAIALSCAAACCYLLPGRSAGVDFDPEGSSGWASKKPVSARHEMVVAANPLAARAGEQVLSSGGSAIDAAIAVQLVLNVVEPQSSGIGGGSFILYHDAKTGRPIAYDGRETAPEAATPDRFLKDGKPLHFFDAVVGGRSVGVPGTLRVLWLAHRQHGKLPWAKLFQPAIAMAEAGFPISPRLAGAIAHETFFTQSEVRNYFYDPHGRPHPEGFVLKNPQLAELFRRIAKEGPDAFYRGSVADDIVATVRTAQNPGDLTRADLEDYRAKVRQPVCGRYRRYRVCGMPPPSSGGIGVLQILGVLERFDLAALQAEGLYATHLFAEAGRLAYADRNAYIADPDFVKIIPGLTDRSYLHERSLLIRTDVDMGKAAAGDPAIDRLRSGQSPGEGDALDLPSTSHLSVVDRWGDAVAMTTTIENGFGSRQMTHGFLLNNELTDFSFVPTQDGKPVANRVEPGKRPRSTMAPTIVYDAGGKVFMVTGSPGGSAIINYVAKALIAVLDWKLDAQAAVDLPNMGNRNGPTELEAGTSLVALKSKLEVLDHHVEIVDFNSGVHSIVRTPKGWMGGADPRREGIAVGN